MARTFEQIMQIQIDEKNSKDELADLNSTSTIAWWLQNLQVHASANVTIENIFDNLKIEVNNIITATKYGTAAWYVSKLFQFQLGDELNVETGSYDVIDESKQIIKRASFVEEAGILILKIAKQDNDILVPLTGTEITQVESYIDKIRVVGTDYNLVSLNADELIVQGTVYYDGIFDLNTIQTNVEAAINNYLGNLAADGYLVRNEIEKAVRSVGGVNDFVIESSSSTSGGTGLIAWSGLNFEYVDRIYLTKAGYIIERTVNGEKFADTINYIASNV